MTTWNELVKHGLCEGSVDPFNDAYSRVMGDK